MGVGSALVYNRFTNTTDNTDHLYRRTNGDLTSTALPLELPLPTNDFRVGELATYWTITDAGWIDNVLQSAVNSPTGAPTYAYAGPADVLSSMYARFPLAGILPDAPAILEGREFEFSWWQMSYSGDDTLRVEIRFIDDTDGLVGTATIGADYAPPTGLVFELVTMGGAIIPALATQVEITLVATRFAGSNNNAYIDGFTARII
jgi:hypothetical protein